MIAENKIKEINAKATNAVALSTISR